MWLPEAQPSLLGQLDGLRYTAQHHMLKAPVELTGIAGGKGERNERLLGARAVAVFPVSDEALHAVIGTAIAFDLQPRRPPVIE